MDQPWTEDSVVRTLIYPNYCLTDPPVVTEEKWIEANAKLVQKMGVETYLTLGKDSCWIVILGCDRLRPRSPLPALGAMGRVAPGNFTPRPSQIRT
jgi:hypothetical protein